MIRALTIAALLAVPVAAAPPSLGLADSFRVGSSGVLCTAQSRSADLALTTMFDRGYGLVCRDAAAAVGSLYALRVPRGAPGAGRALAQPPGSECGAPVDAGIAELPGTQLTRCRLAGLTYTTYTLRRGHTLFAAQGLGGYASALRLGLRALAADRLVAGEVAVAATVAGDPAAFARVQAGSLDPAQALAEGYQRNNAASFAEASEFFDILAERGRQGSAGFTRSAEYLANQALQQSNLGNFVEADALFVRAGAAADPSDPLTFRMLRNFAAMHELNRRRPDAALTALRRTGLPGAAGLAPDRVGDGWIDVPIAQRLNGDDDAVTRLGGVDARLTLPERLAILDAQAAYLEGAVLRMSGKDAAAGAALATAIARLDAVRGGRVQSNGALTAAVLGERSILAERAGDGPRARADLIAAVDLTRLTYPGSAALIAAQARLAALLARQGSRDEALALFREVVRASPSTPGAGQVVRSLVGPYFGLLAGSDGNAADFFAASQILARPGVAQTQAVLARELSGGSDAAAGLFRQSVTLSRDIVRLDGEIAALGAKAEPTPIDTAALAAARAKRETLGRDQTAILAALSDNPRYRVIADSIVTLPDLQAKLRPHESYYKLVLVGDDAYALLATATTARVFRVGATTAELGNMVAKLRDSVVVFENGRATTYPFDVTTSRALYVALFGPADADLPGIGHLIFEPDGALLQLPVNLLVTEQAGADAYAKRAATGGDADFDFTGIAWLGRQRIVSTAVSPRAFLDVRAVAPSRGTRRYLGLGENAPPPLLRTVAADRCDWPASEWRKPISAAELRLGAARDGEVLTGAAFSDTALAARTDLRSFRVLHFATHGLVTAPRAECPARPALLTSFGPGASDGLLSFREIFDLNLDADTVILSACDTAGSATAAATREAGIATGGNYALDGLVRAFVGAGARTVVASHWPVPDDYDATKILISGLFADAPGLGEALRASQVRLMDRKETSHPYYWAGFAIVGDATKALSPTAP